MFYRIAMEIKFGFAQHVEAKMMEVLWLGVMTVMHGITGKAFSIFIGVFGFWIHYLWKVCIQN